MRRLFLSFAAALGLIAVAAPVQAAGIVYMGTDPTAHYVSHPQGVTLARNAVQYAGGNAAPSILLVGSGTGFGGSSANLLTAAGFSFTQITAAQLAATNLNSYQVVYFAPTTSSSEVAAYIAAAAQVQNYVNGGGGLVVEPEVFATGSWSWVPDAALIGHSGATNVGGENVLLNNFPPLSTGLTSAGLSNWGFSGHTTFSTPGAGGYSVLATVNGVPYIIFRSTAAVPEPLSIAVFGGVLAAGGLAVRRRMRATA